MKSSSKAAFALACFVTCFFVSWTLRVTVLYSLDEAITSPVLKALYSNLVKLIIWVLPAVGFVYWVKRENPSQYWAFFRSPAFEQWTACLVATGAFLVATTVFEMGLGHKRLSAAAFASKPLAVSLLSLLISPFLEEVLFRGFVLKELLGLMGLAIANILTSVFFVGAHVPYWLSHGGLTTAVLVNLAGVFLFSLLAGYLFAKSGSVWPPTLAHIANNTLAALLVAHGS